VLVALLHVVTLASCSCSHTCASVHQTVQIGPCVSWELNRHCTWHTSPASAGAWLKDKETEISAALWACVAQEVL